MDLRKSVSQEPGGKIKNYIKGVTNVEELKQDSKVHNLNLSGERIKKLKIETKNNINSVNRRKQKNYTVVAGVHNLRNLKKENTEINSDESDNSENNSLGNIVQNNNNKECLSVEGIGSNNKTNYGTNTNSNNRYLFKDVQIDCEDKIINELAEDLEHTNNKKNENIDKNNNIQTLINKIEPMNINMNINKIENLN